MNPDDIFLFGPLAEPGVLSAVLGRGGAPLIQTASRGQLDGKVAVWSPGARVAQLRDAEGRAVPGLLLRDVGLEMRRRLNYFLSGVAKWGQVRVLHAGMAVDVEAPIALMQAGNAPEFDAAWNNGPWAAAMVEAAGEYMHNYGKWPAPRAAGLWHAMLIRAGARARARAADGPATLRNPQGPEAVQVLDQRRPYVDYFAVEEHDLRFPRFDGTMSDPVHRATFVDGDAVIVLPYDPVRDRVLLVEQFRMGPFVRGDRRPWLLEAVAGRVDGAEPPRDAALRELAEETGLTAARLVDVAHFYPSSGAVTAFFYNFVALVDLPDGVAGVHGVENEAEDIRGHVVSFDKAMALVASGEAASGPLVTLLFWLENRRGDLAAHA